MDTEKEQIRLDSVSNFCLVCYYDNKTKELVRIEQYKDNSSDIQTDINSHKYGYNAEIIKPEELINQLVCKTQECEELRKTVLIKLYKENVCRRNALVEIEDNINKYFEESFYKNCRYAKGCTNACGLVTNSVLNQILDIINKAKGTDNV